MERLKIHKRGKWMSSGPNENSCPRREETYFSETRVCEQVLHKIGEEKRKAETKPH